MLNDHLDMIEKTLISSSEHASKLSHPLQVGNAREYFVKLFLKEHLPETLSIGTGVFRFCSNFYRQIER